MCSKLRLLTSLLLLMFILPNTLLANTTRVEALAKKYLGGKYLWGGTKPSGFDCSGYTQYIFDKVGIELPRTANEQFQIGQEVTGALEKGDLLFFNTDPKRGIPITHVGVYLEEGKFIHAASKNKGIIISPLTGKYQRTYRGAKRILNTNHSNKEHPDESRAIILPNDFFLPFKKALKSPTKLKLNFDPLIIYKGQYVRQSQLKELSKNEP